MAKNCGQCTAHFYNSSGFDVTDLCSKWDMLIVQLSFVCVCVLIMLFKNCLLLAQCPNNKKNVACTINPCVQQTCHQFPHAKCSINTCGECSAKFSINGTDVTNQCSKHVST